MHLFFYRGFFCNLWCFTGSRVSPVLKLEEQLSKMYSWCPFQFCSYCSPVCDMESSGCRSHPVKPCIRPFDSSFHFCFVLSCPISHSVFNHSLLLKYSSGEMLGSVNSGLQLDHALPWRICLQPCLLPCGHRLPCHRGWRQHDPRVEYFVHEQYL